MPIKLNSSQYKTILIVVLVAAASLGIAIKYFGRAFPEASITFKVNRNDSAPIADKFLADRGFHLHGYEHAAVFDYNDNAKLYLERTQGLDRMNALTRGPIHLWRWEHRWFKPLQKEEFRAEVTPDGQVVGFDHAIPEAAAGANLEQADARKLAESFLTEVMKRDLAELEFVEAVSNKRPARTDHTFTWKQTSVNLGDGSLRVEVEVDGDQVAAYREYVKIPEQWTRDYERLRSRNDSAQVIDQVFWFLLTVALLGYLIQRLRDRDVPLRLAWVFGLVAALLYFLGQLNTFSLEKFGYPTTDPYNSFLASYLVRSLLAALGIGTFITLLVAGSEPIYRETFPGQLSLRRTLTWRGLRSRSFFMANVVGLGLTFLFFAYQTVFYLAANRLGAWAPSDIPFSNDLNTSVPWVAVLFTGFFPAVSEEMQFRAFAIPLLKKILRYWPLAIVLAAFNWGFLHSAYPNEPFFIRGLEVGLGGIVMGLIMLRFGIVATLIWHYSVDALYTAFLLLRSPNRYLMLSGGITGGIMLIPLVVALVAYWRTGTFADESDLTNSSVGTSRAPSAAAAEPEAPLVYQPLSSSRVLWGIVLGIALLAASFIHVYRFGEGIELRIDRQDAIRQADEYLKARRVPVEDYRRVAWLRTNINSAALKYLFEHRSIEESDHIYRQATRPVLWAVRYFRPLQKEEYLVFVDPGGSGVFSDRHVLDEDAPGASPSPEQARSLAEQFVEQQGYRLADFDLQDSEAQKRKAREDYALVFQAKSGDPRNIADAHYRLEVDIAGDHVVGFSRFFKLPEEWVRQQQESHLANVMLLGAAVLLGSGLVAGSLFLFVRQVRSGAMPWRPAAAVGGVMAMIFVATELNELSLVYQQYQTSLPLATFRLFLLASYAIGLLGVGLATWLLIAFTTSLYPDVWRILRSSARRAWRRDAAVAVLLGLGAMLASNKAAVLLFNHFHAYAPAGGDLVPSLLSAYWPGLAYFCRGLSYGVFSAAITGVLLYLARMGWTTRTWWFWAGSLLLLASLGPTRAHSVPEFLLGWVVGFAQLAASVGIVVTFLRGNVLAYVLAGFCVWVVQPVVEMLSQPSRFFRWNGVVLGALALAVLAWAFVPGRESEAAQAA